MNSLKYISGLPLQVKILCLFLILLLPGCLLPPSKTVLYSLTGDTRLQAQWSWNIWQEASASGSPVYQPATEISADSSGFLLVVMLAGFPFRGVLGTEQLAASEPFRKFVDEQIKQGASEIKFKALILPDEEYFEVAQTQIQEFTINLKKVKEYIDKPYLPSNNQEIFDTLREQREQASFAFTSFSVPLKPKGKSGVASIALSIWNIYDKPVEEIVVKICLRNAANAACAEPQPTTYVSLRGVDSLRLDQANTEPDAAVHFIDLGDKIRGILHLKGKPLQESAVWFASASMSAIRQRVNTTVLTDFAERDKELSVLLRSGESLYYSFFPEGTAGDRTMKGLVSEAIGSSSAEKPGHSIFVRMIPPPIDPPIFIPFGIMAMAPGPGIASQYFGDLFQIEIPLPRAHYESEQTCICQWNLLLPCPQGALAEGWIELAKHADSKIVRGWLDHKQNACATPPPPPKKRCNINNEPYISKNPEIFSQLKDFRDWLNTPTPKGLALRSQLLMTLSHHSNSQLYVKENDPDRIESQDVQRTVAPSVLILAACGSGTETALPLVRKFNYQGYAAAITTATTIQAALAGHYMGCFARAIEEGGSQGLSLYEAHSSALRCLKEQKPTRGVRKYGPQARVFQLVGNGSLRLCSPLQCSKSLDREKP